MTLEEIHTYLQEKFAEAEPELAQVEAGQPWITVAASCIPPLCRDLRDHDSLSFDTLMCLSGVHYQNEESFGVTYHLHSTRHRHTLVLKVVVPAESPTVPSVATIWRTADWHEREALDMFGIEFEGHPDPCRILCPDDWEGYPLRKDYKPQETYRGLDTGH